MEKLLSEVKNVFRYFFPGTIFFLDFFVYILLYVLLSGGFNNFTSNPVTTIVMHGKGIDSLVSVIAASFFVVVAVGYFCAIFYHVFFHLMMHLERFDCLTLNHLSALKVAINQKWLTIIDASTGKELEAKNLTVFDAWIKIGRASCRERV